MGLVYIANLESGLNVRNALNSMFTELYSAVDVFPIKLTATGTISTTIPADTFVETISIYQVTGSIVLRIGITPNGQEIMSDTAIVGFQPIVVQSYMPAGGVIYFTYTSGSGTLKIRIDVLNNYMS